MTSPEQSESSVSPSKIPRFYSQLKKAHQQRVLPELKEEDIEESFVRGAGSTVLVPDHMLMHISSAHRKRPWWAVCEQDREQRSAAT